MVYSSTGPMAADRIKEVWVDNLVTELDIISDVLDDYPYISMDTEFPGIVVRPVGSFKNTHDYHYQTLKCNVDLLKIIQLGITFHDKEGNLRPGVCTWQFNFNFNWNEDMYADDSINLLRDAGIDFKKLSSRGIDVQVFGELVMTSGLVLNENIRWIVFHGGYDFAYLTKVLSCKNLPDFESDFFHHLRLYFPHTFDVKCMLESVDELKGGGLARLAENLQIPRIGPKHQAGSDSLLTGAVFFRLCSQYKHMQDEDEFDRLLYGLGHNLSQLDKHKNKMR